MGYKFFDRENKEIIMPLDTDDAIAKIRSLINNGKVKKIMLQTDTGTQIVTSSDFIANVGL